MRENKSNKIKTNNFSFSALFIKESYEYGSKF